MAQENTYSDRCVTLTVFRDDGSGISVSQPACIRFDVKLDRAGPPNENILDVLNLSEEMRGQIRNDEFKLIRLEAGHINANNKAVIFEGNVIRSIADDPGNRSNDIQTSIYAGEGQISWRFSTIQQTFPAGTSAIEMVRAALKEMPEITEGNLTGLEGCRPYVRPYPAYESIREFFHDIAETCDCRWSMQRTSLDFIKNSGVNETFTVTKKTCATGLQGSELTEHGVIARTILDPAIRPNGVVEIDNERNPASNGFWRVDSVRHKGGTNAKDEFYSEFLGIKLSEVRRVEGTQERIRFQA